jgi:PAS domain S-box-containing protein
MATATDPLVILAIDDNQDNLTTLKAMIAEAFPGARVLIALEGKKGLDLAQSEDPDVILLDIVMPGLDGFEVCRRLKADSWLRLIPVIFVTAQQGDRQSRIKALEVGGEAFLTKPIEEAELTAQIRAMAKIKAGMVSQRQEKERLAALVAERTRELNRELAGHHAAEAARQQATQKLLSSQAATLNLLEDLKAENDSRRKSEEALSRAKDDWERTFDAVPDLICLLDSGHTILRVNQAMADKLGVSSKAAVGLKCYQCVHGLEAPPDFCPHARLLEDQQPHDGDVHEDRLGGDFHITCTPLFDQSGKLLGSVHVARDITASKQAIRALRQNETMLRDAQLVAGLGSYSFDLVAGLWSSSEVLDQILGIDAAFEHSFSGWLRLVHPDDRQMMQEYFTAEVVGKRGRFDKEYRVVRNNDQAVRWVHGMGKLEIDGQDRVVKMIGTIQDITEHKRAEFELEQYRNHLEVLVDKRTAELAEARDQAQAANRAKSVFLANMSHELRTPLTAILGFSQIMSRERNIPVQEQHNLGIILRSGEHLLALINDILDLSKIDAGRSEVDTHNVALDELFRDVVNMMRMRAEAKGLQLMLSQSADLPRFVCTDSGKLRQIIINLVGNAIKFTSSGQVVIRLAAKSIPTGHQLSCEVEDSGVGIAQGDLERIFLPFEQTGNKQLEGTGLGLAITRQYVEMLGGRISADSTLGKGSCFRFIITVGRVEENAQGRPVDKKVIGIESPTANLRLLIVEDQPENRLLLRCFLEPHGFQLREAVNGQEAVSVFQEWRPHVIFMDRRMPVLDGLTATRQIRSLPGGSEPVIIAVSAHSFKEEQREMLMAGCNDFLGKPFNGDSLLTLLQQHLHLHLAYAASEAIPAAVSRLLSADDLRTLPQESLQTLHRLALEGDDSEIEKWLASSNGLTPAAQEALAKLIKEYHFEIIQELVAPLVQGK